MGSFERGLSFNEVAAVGKGEAREKNEDFALESSVVVVVERKKAEKQQGRLEGCFF